MYSGYFSLFAFEWMNVNEDEEKKAWFDTRRMKEWVLISFASFSIISLCFTENRLAFPSLNYPHAYLNFSISKGCGVERCIRFLKVQPDVVMTIENWWRNSITTRNAFSCLMESVTPFLWSLLHVWDNKNRNDRGQLFTESPKDHLRKDKIVNRRHLHPLVPLSSSIIAL